MAKMGRPIKEDKKKKSIGVRLSDEDYDRLMRYASQQGLTITQTVQEALEKMLQGL